ncbi:hypothetical protein [Xenorhabdus bovienii]|uniref:hypothetical protein n=1 Tax=Xenorhabdus bovienii TaxID=40576 RepID=UPI003DA44E44
MISERLIFTESELDEFNDLMINSFLAQKLNLPLSCKARIWLSGESDIQHISAVDKDPVRAAMKVLLMMGYIVF